MTKAITETQELSQEEVYETIKAALEQKLPGVSFREVSEVYERFSVYVTAKILHRITEYLQSKDLVTRAELVETLGQKRAEVLRKQYEKERKNTTHPFLPRRLFDRRVYPAAILRPDQYFKILKARDVKKPDIKRPTINGQDEVSRDVLIYLVTATLSLKGHFYKKVKRKLETLLSDIKTNRIDEIIDQIQKKNAEIGEQFIKTHQIEDILEPLSLLNNIETEMKVKKEIKKLLKQIKEKKKEINQMEKAIKDYKEIQRKIQLSQEIILIGAVNEILNRISKRTN